MKRAVLVEYDQASPSIRAIYDEIMEATGKPDVPNIMKALGNNENALRAVWTMFRNTVIEGEIPNLLKELILFRISIHAGNEYCRSLHAHAACTLDPTLTYRDLRAMAEGESLKGLPASFQAAIDLVSCMALNTLTAAYDVPWEGPPMGDDT
jgi:alkylhydroperoxidase family enzyme